MTERVIERAAQRRGFALHGWIGIGLIAVFWILNWTLDGTRTAWAFFPLWLGYCLTVDALSLRQNGTSLLQRDWKRYIGLFLVSAPVWWLFEALNSRLGNWHYLGRDQFSNLEYFMLASLNFSVVIPAVFGAAELASGFTFIRRMKPDLRIVPNLATTLIFFALGGVFLFLVLRWPQTYFPFVWMSLYLILEPVNVWLGNRHLARSLRVGDWCPVVSLFVGVLITGFFWEMWNYYSFPKWVYTVPGVDFWKVFEMPLLGYGGYLPFALELFAIYHMIAGLLGDKEASYVHLDQPDGAAGDL
ncbi:MAG TPA: hypothetical protein VHO48_10620 [Anaerolineaceae bacterium]|nr:hypothetical protein [Anaerolineaceae bacterium]